MMIQMFLCLQLLVISILLKEFELKSIDEAGINKRQPSYMADLINRYNKARPNDHSSGAGAIFHWDCHGHRCKKAIYGPYVCQSWRRKLNCKTRAPDSESADPNKWKPHPDCLTVFYYDKWYIKGCRVGEIPYCYTRQDDYHGWKYCIDISKVDGAWSEWSSWSDCSKTCGPDSGSRSRVRECDSPSPQQGGKDCPGEKKESEECNKSECPIHGGWSQWSAGSSCYKTCGKRERECDNPSPKFGGRDCEGPKMDEKICSAECPVDGNWTQWSNWTQCKKSCGKEYQNRYRSCTAPSERNRIINCEGKAKESRFCSHMECQKNMKKMSTQSGISKILFPIIASMGALILSAAVIAAVMTYRRKRMPNLDSTNEQSYLYQESGMD